MEAYKSALADAALGYFETRVIIRADRLVSYEQVMTMMNATQDAGFLKAFVTADDRP